jgi:putative transposase
MAERKGKATKATALRIADDGRTTPQALECDGLTSLSPLGAPVHQAAPRLAARGVPPNVGLEQSGGANHLDGDKSPAESGDKSPHSKVSWPHAPIHKLNDNAVYFVTAGTLHKERLFTDKARLDLLERRLMELANQYHWQLEAWAAFANHYHIVARGFPDSVNLGKFLSHLHSDTARELNRLDCKEGRKVWFNFRDTKLTFEKSYLARCNYVHQNAVHHKLVPVANQYPWCSAAWFERIASPAMVQTIYSFKTDQLNIEDDF